MLYAIILCSKYLEFLLQIKAIDMVRTVYSPEYCLQYLEQNANNEIFSLGLILGQVSRCDIACIFYICSRRKFKIFYSFYFRLCFIL